MSQKADKRIRKQIKKDIKGTATLQAKWRFPWSLFKKHKKGWVTIPDFPKKQWRFEFRIIYGIEKAK